MNKIITEAINNIPNYTEFLTVDELNKNSLELQEKYPDTVEVITLGYSRKNNPIHMIKIGNGKKHALLYGCPHPNEPIGTLVLDCLSNELAKNSALRETLDYTFLIIKTVDPDGTILNEGWFKGDINIRNYALNFYRPEADAQVDWTFPINYKKLDFNKPIPETKLLMGVIDTFRPVFIYPMHNAGFGGTYWYISRPMEHLYKRLYEASQKANIPLHLGEPEMPFIHQYAPAIFKIVGTKQIYDYMEPLLPKGTNPSEQINNGTCSHEYAENTYTPFSVMTELPYFLDKQVADTSLTSTTRKNALLKSYSYQNRTLEFILENISQVEDVIDKENNPFYKAIQMYINGIRNNQTNVKMIQENDQYNNFASKAEVFDTIVKSKFYMGLLAIGVLYRLTKMELDKLPEEKNRRILLKANKMAHSKLHKIADEIDSELNYEIVPIKKMIRVQLETGLILLDEIIKEG